MHYERLHRTALAALVLAAGLSTPVLALCPPTEDVTSVSAPPPDARAKALQQRAHRVIGAASSWTQGALEWMSREGGEMKARADRWRASAADRLTSAIDYALDAPAPPTGLRVLTERAGEHGVASSTQSRPDWLALESAPALPAHVVVLIHGLDEPGNVWDELGPMLHAGGHCVVRFDYPDDQSLAASGSELIAALAKLKSAGVTTIDLVCHSMGGLLARDALTRPGAYAGDARGGEALPAVDRWIMMAVPNHGAPLARVRFISEAREHLVRWIESEGSDPRQLLGFLKDGAGEAGDDLLPDSPYLRDLSSRALPEHVRITNVIGAAADHQRQQLEDILRSAWISKVLAEREVERMISIIERANDSIGDGIVSMESARLAGVEDQVVVPSLHRMLAKRPMGEAELLETMGQPPNAPDAAWLILDRLSR